VEDYSTASIHFDIYNRPGEKLLGRFILPFTALSHHVSNEYESPLSEGGTLLYKVTFEPKGEIEVVRNEILLSHMEKVIYTFKLTLRNLVF
jgi:hypothetical protein